MTDQLEVRTAAPPVGFGRWLLRTFVGGTVLGGLMFVVYLLVAFLR